MSHSINPKTPPRPCTAHDLTWGPKGARCLNCGSESEHSFDLKHSPQPAACYVPPFHRHLDYFNAVRDPNNPNDR